MPPSSMPPSSMRSAWVGQKATAASTWARMLSGGDSSRTSRIPFLLTANTAGASDSHTP